MRLKDRLSKWRREAKPSEESAPPQTLPSAGPGNPASTSHSSPLPTSTTSWKSKIMPRFLLRGHKDSPVNEQKEAGPKPSVSPLTVAHTATNTTVVEKKSERETLSPLQFQSTPVNQNAPSTRKAPMSTITTSKPVTATQPKTLAQYARHDGKGAVGMVSTPASHTPYPIRQYVGGKKVLAQYGHPDNKGAARRY